MKVSDILQAQAGDGFSLSYFKADEFVGFARVSVMTEKYGMFRFKINEDDDVEIIKKRIAEIIHDITVNNSKKYHHKEYIEI